ncbi:MAG: acyl-CoA thioesterase [Candidatus Bipolaricaulia bacterium]
MHRSTWKVSFGEVDYAGIVYYPNFFDYFQRVEEEFMEQVGFPYQRLLGEMGIGFPIVGVEASFKRPVRYSDTIEIILRVARLGKSSVTFSFQVFKEREFCAEASITHVTIDLAKFAAIEIPEELRAAFQGPSRTGPSDREQRT